MAQTLITRHKGQQIVLSRTVEYTTQFGTDPETAATTKARMVCPSLADAVITRVETVQVMRAGHLTTDEIQDPYFSLDGPVKPLERAWAYACTLINVSEWEHANPGGVLSTYEPHN